jgi:predicted  nucleic acid-binding Zn-ribbon protein
MLVDSWVKSARASLDKLEWEIEYARNERIELSVQVNDLEKEVKRLRKGMKMMLDDMNNASPEEDIKYWLDTWKHWLKEMIE